MENDLVDGTPCFPDTMENKNDWNNQSDDFLADVDRAYRATYFNSNGLKLIKNEVKEREDE